MTTDLDDEKEHGYFRDESDTATPDDRCSMEEVFEAKPIAGPDVEALGQCGWHLRQLARVRHDIAVLDAVYAAELDRLRLRHQTHRDRLTGAAEWHEAPLRSYMAMRLDTDGLKTLELPNGTIRTRTPSKPTLLVDDPAAVAKWAGDVLPDVVTYRPQIDKRALTAYVHASGEIPPGVTIVPPATTYTITPEGLDDD